ncbi:hypothetical protein DSL72_001167 [Monilinia vaccinii-corymbosi]|uniref:Uncharacterized protein n=1 Tax=Monilinia vaccinii-corymbosi TaxID=61207 RepID=A0A8A3P4C6_9HELO|nr:hypothetical protein DSL72_001167 [Monilinia vaccinii-corymbosi]
MLSCTVIDGAQMLIVGGSFPKDQSTCDSVNSWGTHNLDLNEPAANTLPWNTYQPNLTSYAVPLAIIAAVGGFHAGGATMRSPSSGFQDNDLNVYFPKKASAANRTPIRAITTATGSSTPNCNTPEKLAPAAIAGMVVGAVGIVGILAACFFFCMIRVRKSHAHVPEVSAPIVPAYGPGNASKPFPRRTAGPQLQSSQSSYSSATERHPRTTYYLRMHPTQPNYPEPIRV